MAENHHLWLHWSITPADQEEISIPIQHNEMALLSPIRLGREKQTVVEMFRRGVPLGPIPGGDPMLRAVEIDDRFNGGNGGNPDVAGSGIGAERL